MNSVILIGRMVFEPEVKTTKNGTAFTSLRLAVDRRDKDRTTDFINCKAWGKTAEFIGKYFHKGDPIEIQGRLQNEAYEKTDGTKVNDTVVMIYEAGFCLMSKSSGGTENPPREQEAPKKSGGMKKPTTSTRDEMPDDGNTELPFEI